MRRAMTGRHIFAGLALLALVGCGSKPQATKAQKAAAAKAEAVVGTNDDVLQALGRANDLSTMTTFVKSAGLEKTLEGIGDYTLFAPTDAAFAKLPTDQHRLLASKDGRTQLLALLRQHIATGYITQADITRGLARNAGSASLATMGGAPVRLHRSGNAIFLGSGDSGPRLIGAPIASRNGVIYRIDQVIPPERVGSRLSS
jgi:uncharacterized surface protein with fasciclin (FAS1) repeats